MTAKLILPIAPPAAGKSYTASKLIEDQVIEPQAVVEPDYFRWLLSGDRANQEVNSKVFDIVNTLVTTRLYYGQNVYLDATNVNPGHRTKLLQDIHKLKKPVSLIVLISKLDEKILYERNTNRPYPVPQHVIKNMWKTSQEMQVEVLKRNYKAQVYTLEEAQKWKELP